MKIKLRKNISYNQSDLLRPGKEMNIFVETSLLSG